MKNCRIILFILLFFTGNIIQVPAQLRFHQFKQEHGLSQHVIYKLFSDKKGFLWIATHDGLNRYDGYEFKKFYHNPYDSTSIAQNMVMDIAEDSSGKIWVLTLNYLHCFDVSRQQFFRYRLPDHDLSIVQSDKAEILALNNVEILVKTSSGIIFFDNRIKQFRPVRSGAALSTSYDCNKKSIIKTGGGDVIMSAPEKETGILYYDKISMAFVKKETEWHQLVADVVVTKMFKSGNRHFFLLPQKNELLLTTVNSAPLKISLNAIHKKLVDTEIYDIVTDEQQNCWLATRSGLFLWNPQNKTAQQYTYRSDDPHSIPSNNIRTLLIDSYNNLWLGSYGAGLGKCKIGHNPFKNLTTGGAGRHSLPAKFIYSIREGKSGRLYISFYSDQNIAMIDSSDYTVSVIDRKNPLPDHIIKDMYQVPGTIKLSDSLYRIFARKLPWSVGNPAIFTDRYQQTWINRNTYLENVTKQKKIMLGYFIEAIYQGLNGEIWIGTNGGGLYRLGNDSVLQRYQFDPARKKSISNNTVNAILPGNSNELWLATHYGLNMLKIGENSFEHYTKDNGLAHHSIYSMVMDDEGNIWCGTGNGISRFDTAAKSFRNYNRSDGLINTEFNRYSALKTSGGILVFGGTEGLDLFYPRQLSVTTKPAATEITGFRVFNREIPFDKPVTLLYNESSISVAFAGMDFSNPQTTKYRYILKGSDKDWSYTEGNNSVSYGSLKPGTYTFLVKAANDKGEWSDTEAMVSFTIRPPWWQTWWFYSLLLILIFAALFTFSRYKLKKRLEIYQLRNRIHRDLHDDIGASLSTMKAYAELLKKQPGKTTYLDLIEENADEMLDKLEIITWANNPENDNLRNLVNKMKLLAQPIFYHKGIELEIFIEPGLDQLILPGVVRQNLFLIFKEAMNNIIKHSCAAACRVTIQKNRKDLVMNITDNGNGFEQNQTGTGNGLMNMLNRVKDLKGKFEIHSENGTSIELKIPIQ